jgi:protein TonB
MPRASLCGILPHGRPECTARAAPSAGGRIGLRRVACYGFAAIDAAVRRHVCRRQCAREGAMRSGLATLLLILCPLLVQAAEPAAPIRVSAHPVKREPPEYPSEALHRGQEGWVEFSFVLQADGTARDIVVVDSSGLASFEQAGLAALQQWRWAPPTVDGVPVEQSGLHTRINFRLDPPQTGARLSFVKKYKDAMQRIDARDIAGADARIAALEAEPLFNLYEDAWFWLLKSAQSRAHEDPRAELIYLRRAAPREEDFLPREYRVQALGREFVLEVQQGHYADALQTWERVRKIDGDDALGATLQPVATQVGALLEGAKAIAVEGTIPAGKAGWNYRLARHEFALDNVDGAIAGIDLRCDAQARELDWQADVTWKLPAAWGCCRVYVRGAEGTRFRLLEYPDAPPPPSTETRT